MYPQTYTRLAQTLGLKLMEKLKTNLPCRIQCQTVLLPGHNLNDVLPVELLNINLGDDGKSTENNATKDTDHTPGALSISYDVLFPVVIRSPVVPFPNWPFSALPNENTSTKHKS